MKKKITVTFLGVFMDFSNSGEFFTGCNYWASNAGTDMWTDWNVQELYAL